MSRLGKRPWFYVYTIMLLTRSHLFAMRSMLNVTISRLRSSKMSSSNRSNMCPEVNKWLRNGSDFTGMDLVWENSQMDCILFVFYVGYVLSLIPSGYLADKYGSKHILSVGFLINALITASVPWLMASLPWWAMAIARGFMGIGQAMYIAAEFSLMAHWIPEQLSTFLLSTLHNGIAFGIIINCYTTYYFFDLLNHHTALFYIYSCIGIIIYFVIILTIFSTPAENPFHTEEERMMLDKVLDSTYPTNVPWCMILKDHAVWSLAFGTIGHQWMLSLISHGVLNYFKIVIGLDIKQNMWSMSLPYWAMTFSCFITAYFVNKILKRGFIPVNFMRTYVTIFGNILSSLTMVIVSNSGCNQTWVVILFSLALLFKGAIYAGLDIGVFDLTRRYCGIINGIKNTLGGVPGILTPILVSHICTEHSIAQWQKMFWISFSVVFTTTIMYYIWSRSEKAEWDSVEKDKEEESI